MLTEHGAVVTGSLHAPLAQELEGVSVLVIYKGDAGYLSEADRAALEAFIKRGGGIVSLHDALCGPDPEYFVPHGYAVLNVDARGSWYSEGSALKTRITLSKCASSTR